MTRTVRAATADPSDSDGRPTGKPEPASLEAMVAALEEDIVLGRLHPRERLIEEDLIARFGATRHLARQALIELDRMGLIERIPNRGAQVRSYTVEEVEQLYVLRGLLEAEAARLIALPMPADDLAELKALQVTHDTAIAAGEVAAIFRANLAFHRKLFSCCRNVFLSDAITAAAQRAHGIRFLVLTAPHEREAARQEHHAMIAAIEALDSDLLVQLCRNHLPASKAAYLRAFGQVPRDSL
ncbi:MAG TPA: GntR family transcriptional regulator [Xanthobacteraceae bacterium]|nr:GntR family transcriptional regulator [Xanthobacteraceae bacterium]HQS47571.1 GntR family transcriptional regulator [Xanthobacteraceae bacterium]